MGSHDDGDYYDCEIEFDGASKGNPGKSGAGAILRDRRTNTTWHLREGLGFETGNAAEYRSLIRSLRTARDKGCKRVHVSGGSSLVYNQVVGNWQTRNPNMRALNDEVQDLRSQFDSFKMEHVSRERNKDADSEANKACLLPEGWVCED